MNLNHLISWVFQRVFRLLAWLRPPLPEKLESSRFRNILVFSAAGIGDTLTDSPSLRALKESFPQSTIHVVTHRRRIVLVQHNPYVDRVIPYHKSIVRFFSLILELRGISPDVIVMLRGNDPDLWPIAYLVRRGVVVSCPVMTRFGFLISHPVPIPEWDQTHGVEQTLRVVQSIGATTREKGLVYRVTDEERNNLRKKLADFGISWKPMVVFQVGGGKRSTWRDWPIEHFVELGRRLLGEYDTQLILLGGGDQAAKADEIRDRLAGRVTVLAGKLTLVESAALLSLSKTLVSTDTGIMHLGFAVGVDTLALIHCNNPSSRVGPWGYGDQHPVVELPVPPGQKASKEISMTDLTPEMAWEKLKKLCERNGIPLKA